MSDKLEELMGALATLRACLREIGPYVDVEEIVLRRHPLPGQAIGELQSVLAGTPTFRQFQARIPGADMLAHGRCEVQGVTIREATNR